jgi:hypothetical protein
MLKMDNHCKLLEVLLFYDFIFVIGIKTIFPPSAAITKSYLPVKGTKNCTKTPLQLSLS